jgi:class 3 adenylate cyclase
MAASGGVDLTEERILRLRRRERIRELRNFILVSCRWVSLPLFAAFVLCDYFYAPTKLLLFAGLRSIVIPSYLLVSYLVKRRRDLWKVQALGAFYVLINAWIITVLAFLVDGKTSVYYAGLNLCAILVCSFIPWTFDFLLYNLAFIYLPFYVLSFLSWNKPGNSIFIVNSFFMGSTVIITMVIRHFNEKFRMAAIRSRVALDEELDRRARIIKEKSEEALSLAELAKQFSPQVVHAIRTGEMQISDSVKESEICVVFIDVCDSTPVMQAVGIEAYQNAMNLYLSIAVPILFKYDITFDKMIGDAIMGFSNEPAKRSDYIARMGAACLEIRDTVHAREDELAVFWARPFQLKIGLANGVAKVGFQGQIVRAYTATGMVVNTANRLCDIAAPGQIVSDSSSLEAFTARGFQTLMLGTRSLRGIGEQNIYELEAFGAASNERWSEVSAQACVVCGTILHLEENPSGILVLKCGNCDFVLS